MANLGRKNIAQLITVVVGSPKILMGAETSEEAQFTLPYPLTIKATPGAGGTLLVEYRITPTGAFSAWPSGTVAAATVMKLNGPVEGLRFTAAVADGVCEVAQ